MRDMGVKTETVTSDNEYVPCPGNPEPVGLLIYIRVNRSTDEPQDIHFLGHHPVKFRRKLEWGGHDPYGWENWEVGYTAPRKLQYLATEGELNQDYDGVKRPCGIFIPLCKWHTKIEYKTTLPNAGEKHEVLDFRPVPHEEKKVKIREINVAEPEECEEKTCWPDCKWWYAGSVGVGILSGEVISDQLKKRGEE